jgi:hypothetical protein
MEEDIPYAQACLKLSEHSLPKMYFLNLNNATRNSRTLEMLQNVSFTGNYKMLGRSTGKTVIVVRF